MLRAEMVDRKRTLNIGWSPDHPTVLLFADMAVIRVTRYLGAA